MEKKNVYTVDMKGIADNNMMEVIKDCLNGKNEAWVFILFFHCLSLLFIIHSKSRFCFRI